MSHYNMTVKRPVIQDRDFFKPILCGPGPCDIWPSIPEVLTKPIISPLCDEYYKVLDEIRSGLQYLFQTQSPTVFAMCGSGQSGMDIVISNLVGPGETLLVAARGVWDERAYKVASRYGLKPIVTKIPFNETFSLQHLEAELSKHRPTALFITHGDSSTGTVQNLQGLGEICHRYETLLLVDTVASLGGEPFFMDAWEIDAVYAASQKALSGPAGLSPIAFSQRALDKINNRKHEPPFYFDVKLITEQWNCHGNTRGYHHTISLPIIWAFRQCLREIINETLPNIWDRHVATAAHLRKRMQVSPFEFLIPKPEDRLVTVTMIVLPEGYDHVKFVKRMKAKYNIVVFPGLGPTAGKALRIGLMGVNARIDIADALADAMMNTLKSMTKSSL